MNLRALSVTVRVAARKSLADRGGLLFSGVFVVVVAGALGALWRAAAGAGGGEIAGYGAVALTWYIATSESATVSLNTRLVEAVGDDIGSGLVAMELLRPVSVLAIRVATELGRSLPRLAVCLLAGSALSAVVAGPPPDAWALALAVPSLVLAITCNIVAMHAFGAASFWLREARSTWFLYQKLVFVVGGMLLPLEVLPATMETVSRALPFMAMAYAPARLASGHFEPHLLLVQVGWLVVLSVVAARVFAAGERRLQVVGG